MPYTIDELSGGQRQRVRIAMEPVKQVFELDCDIIEDPVSRSPLLIPKGGIMCGLRVRLKCSGGGDVGRVRRW